MLMTDDTFNWPHSEFLSSGDADDDDGMSIDIGALFDILEESPMENSQVGLSDGNILQESSGPNIGIKRTSQPQSEYQVIGWEPSLGIELPQPSAARPPCNNIEALVSQKGYADVPLDPTWNSTIVGCGGQESLAQFPSLMNTWFGNHDRWCSHLYANYCCCNGMDGVPQFQVPSCRREPKFSVGFLDEAIRLKCSYGNNENLFIEKDANHPLPASFPFITRHSDIDFLQDEKEITLLSKRPRNTNGNLTDCGYHNFYSSCWNFPFTKPCISPDNQIGCIVNECEGILIPSTSMGYDFPKFSPEFLQR